MYFISTVEIREGIFLSQNFNGLSNSNVDIQKLIFWQNSYDTPSAAYAV